MKKIYFIVSITTVLLILASCSDWLDMPSESKADDTTIFETVGRAEMAVVGCYPNTFNRELYYQLGMGTDECISIEGETNSKNQVANYQYTTSNIPTSTYKAMYAGIECANVCIQNISLMKNVPESDRKRLDACLGEALAIRAMNYWNLVRFFGDVPYSDTPVGTSKNFSSSRVSRDTIYDHCITDLQRAVKLLPWMSEGIIKTPERFSKNSAYGILARVALYAAGYSLRWDLGTVPYNPQTVTLSQRSDKDRIEKLYSIAADACEQVILKNENRLLVNYEDVFRDLVNGRYNNETMLEYGQWGTNVNESSVGYTIGVFCHTESMFKKATPQMVAIPTYYFDFKTDDTRRDVTICNYGISASSIHQMNTYAAGAAGKYRVNWKKEVGTALNKRDINWPVLRYSDVLLMYAEALNEKNKRPVESASDALKKVRMRAFGENETKIGVIPEGYEEFKKAIIEERKLELGMESWRRTDLARWGILYETLMEEKGRLLKLAGRKDEYEKVDKYRAYKEIKATFEDPYVAVPYKTINEAVLTSEEIALLNKNGLLKKNFFEDNDGNIYLKKEDAPVSVAVKEVGYTVLDMFSDKSTNNTLKIAADQKWMTTSLFRGLEKNKVEILPLNSENIIDINPGLAGQQHPCY